MWLVVKVTLPRKLEDHGRRHTKKASGEDEQEDIPNWISLIRSKQGWRRVSNLYTMALAMVWTDVTIGVTVAGIIAAFVPRSFFQALVVGSGTPDPGLLNILLQALVGPLAAVLFSNGVSFAGIIAFIFSDLVVFPVLRIQAQYYGGAWPCITSVCFWRF